MTYSELTTIEEKACKAMQRAVNSYTGPDAGDWEDEVMEAAYNKTCRANGVDPDRLRLWVNNELETEEV